MKRRDEKGYFNNIVQELKVEDRLGFKEMFRMDFEFIFGKISQFISSQEIIGCHKPILADERIAQLENLSSHLVINFESH